MTPETKETPHLDTSTPPTPPAYHIHINKDKEILLLTQIAHELQALHSTQRKVHAELHELTQPSAPKRVCFAPDCKDTPKPKPDRAFYYMAGIMLVVAASGFFAVSGVCYLHRMGY